MAKSSVIRFLPALVNRHNVSTTALSLLCIVSYLLSFRFGLVTFGADPAQPTSCFILSSLLYSFSHVNIFHLSINLVALFKFRPRPSTAFASFTIAALVPLLGNSVFSVPTCGISVLLYGAVSRYYVAWHKPIYRPLLSNVILFAVNLAFGTIIYNWQAHLVAFFMGYIFWWIVYRYRG